MNVVEENELAAAAIATYCCCCSIENELDIILWLNTEHYNLLATPSSLYLPTYFLTCTFIHGIGAKVYSLFELR